MSLLQDRVWKLKYTLDDGDLVQLFYVPALRAGTRYDRITGYFSAGAFALAARGVEGLVLNDGKMRLLVGCTLNTPETEAMRRASRSARQSSIIFSKRQISPPIRALSTGSSSSPG